MTYDFEAVWGNSSSESAVQPSMTCPCCNGSGWVVRDPDIGTDQECFVCDGTGVVDNEDLE